MNIIEAYFPNLTSTQIEQFKTLEPLYNDWNAKINVISRKDIQNLYEHHVLHSLAIAKILKFQSGTTVVDVGTGGGFPGIPLAILFPKVQFHLVDSVGKKIHVVEEVVKGLGLQNVTYEKERIENVNGKYDFVVSRAALPLDILVKMCRKNIAPKSKNALPNGLICLKGGELQAEMAPYKKMATLYHLSEFFKEDYFKTKEGIYLPL